MPEVTMLLGAALGIFLVIAIFLISRFHRPARDRRSSDGVVTDAGSAGSAGSKSSPDSGGWSSGGEAGGGDGGGGD